MEASLPCFFFLSEVEHGLVCTKNRYEEYTPVECFSDSVLSAVTTLREGVKNRKENVEAKTVKLLANNCYLNQGTVCSRHSIT